MGTSIPVKDSSIGNLLKQIQTVVKGLTAMGYVAPDEQQAVIADNPALVDLKAAPDRSSFIFKAPNGRYAFLATYSNNLRDNDWFPEIISGESHKRFVELVKEGKAPLPELWIFHEQDLKVGECIGVAVDEYDNGVCFALAYGYFDEGMERIAESLMQLDVLPGMSHGMPVKSLSRLQTDSSIITQHETVEVSILPRKYAANRVTEFVTVGSEEKGKAMAVDPYVREIIETELGIPASAIDALESRNQDRSKAADVLFIDRKSVDPLAGLTLPKDDSAPADGVVPTADNEQAPDISGIASDPAPADVAQVEPPVASTPTPAPEPVPETEPAPAADPEPTPAPAAPAPAMAITLDDIAGVIASAIQGAIAPLQETINSLSQRLETAEAKAKQLEEITSTNAMNQTPTHTLAAMVMANMTRSAVGQEPTKIDGRSSLAKDKPEETDPTGGDSHMLTGLA